MRGRLIWLLITANLLALLGLTFVYPAAMVSPGPVVPAHAAIGSECFACHAPFRGASPGRCSACHALGDIGVRTTMGSPLRGHAERPAFHQELIEQDCNGCHTDHVGASVGQRSKKPFSHGLLHAATQVRCETCHKPPTSGSHPQVTDQCQKCHTAERWRPASFDHARFFELDRDHAVVCATCHAENNYERYTCYGCHEHTQENIRAEHEEEGIRNFDNCVSCHKSPKGKPGGRGEGRRKEH
jgi:hypothetical protein